MYGPPFKPELLAELANRVVSWEGEAWRVVFEGSGALSSNSKGARWNTSEFEAFYFSLTLGGAHAELDFIESQQPVRIKRPRAVYSFQLRFQRVLDLRDVSGLDHFGVEAGHLVADSWDAPQSLAHAAYKLLDCSAVLVPSARSDATNLAVFTGGLTRGDSLSDPSPFPNGPVEV